jgi:2-amino-4-hydroxy-6-hydroxymethyldihydropteridine diphosphokinase
MNATFCRAGVAMGSNIEPRFDHLQSAISFLRGLNEEGAFLVSSLFETEPVGCPPGTQPFLNAVAEFSTRRRPMDLLHSLQAFETSLGRSLPRDKNLPRTIDLDLLYLDNHECEDPELLLPHPRIPERAFVLVPLAEIAPLRILPGQSRTVAELAAHCDQAGLRPYSKP